ncbi:MAG: PEP-CTERM sorting domain-containing protein [Planctomycetota bacterium]
MNAHLRRLALLGVLAAATGASAQLETPALVFDTQIVSFDFAGTALLPLGPDGALINTQITGTRATDHNSSRSNKTSSTTFKRDPDDVDPDDLDGELFSLFSTIDVRFDLALADVDPLVDFSPLLGPSPRGTLDSPASLELEQGSTFLFDADAPDFGMLRAAGPGKQTHRGHVTVLKIAVGGGGGGGDIDLEADGILVSLEPGTSSFKPTGVAGEVEHVVGFELGLRGSFDSVPFQIDGIGGTLVERGSLANAVVPEPSSLAGLLGFAGWLACGRRR